MAGDKVYFGFQDVHIAFMAEDSAPGNPKWEEPTPIPGAVSFTPAANNQSSKFYADNRVYHEYSSNDSYSGDLTVAAFPKEVLARMLGWEIDKNGALVDTADGETTPFAFMATVRGNKRGKRIVFYNCTGSTPSSDMTTTTDSREVQTETMAISIIPCDLGVDLGNGSDRTRLRSIVEYDSNNPEAYNNFFKEVYIPEPIGNAPAPIAVTGVSVNPTTISIAAGGTETFTVTVTPDNADDKTFAAASDNTDITASINGTTVTLVAIGGATTGETVNITVTTTDGSLTAVCEVTVS